ncbi:MAG: hypothetical protein J5667_00800 [Bacteroidales bacterium]|nr:hypothetical protein [Bacteroidales bacterium]
MNTLGNFFWLIFGGLLFCITIVGIPLGLQHFKMILPALLPFGKKIQ